MEGMVNSVPWLSGCVDDLNSTSRLMRKWLEETPQIVYGRDLFIEVDVLRDRFTEWKQQNNIRSVQSSGPYLEWTATAVDDAFSYAERRLGGRGPEEDSSIEPKDISGMLRPNVHPLEAVGLPKVFTGITWREVHGRPSSPRPDRPEGEETGPRMGRPFL